MPRSNSNILESTGERGTVFRLGRLQAPEGAAPSVRAQVVPHAIAPAATSVMDTLGASLGDFFGTAWNATEHIISAKMEDDRREKARAQAIADEERRYQQREQRAQQSHQSKIAGAAAAQRGEELTPEDLAARDFDFTENYKGTRGSLLGSSLADQWTARAEQLPPGTDLEGDAMAFLKGHLRNGDKLGTGDNTFDAAAIESYRRGIDRTVNSQREMNAKAVVSQGLADKRAELAARLDVISGDDLDRYTDEFVKANPMDPTRGAADLVHSLIGAAGNDPRRQAKVLSLIRDSDFAKLFPEQALQVEDNLTARRMNGDSWDGTTRYNDLERRIEDAKTPEEVLDILRPGGELDATLGRYGSESRYKSLQSKARSLLQGHVKDVATLDAMDGIRVGQQPLDASFVRQNLSKYMRERLKVDPFQEPEKAASVIRDFKYIIDDDTKVELSAALAQRSDPKRFEAAYRVVQSIQGASGSEEVARSLLSEAGAVEYLNAQRMSNNGTRPLSEVFLELKDTSSRELKEIDKVSWKSLTGSSTEADAEDLINKRLLGVLKERYDGDLSVSPLILNDLRERTKRILLGRGGSGDWRAAADDAAKAYSNGLQAFPSGDGKVSVEPVRVRQGKTDIPFGKSINPNTGKEEDTAATFQRDLTALHAVLPELSTSGYGGISVSGRTRWAKDGVWALVGTSGTPVAFYPGQTVKVAGEAITIPEDPAAAKALFETKFHFRDEHIGGQMLGGDLARSGQDVSERFRVLPYPPSNPTMYILGYVPGYTGKALPTVDMKERNFKTPAPLPEPEPFSLRPME